MSEPKNFLSRWSARKLTPEAEPAALEPKDNARAPAAKGEAAPPTSAEAFDISTLPPLDSIMANSDIRAFLQRGVPAELTRAALRRAWSADPAIRDFIGLSENAWDFNKPESIPGFGSLSSDDLKRVAQLFEAPKRAAEGRAAPDLDEKREEMPSSTETQAEPGNKTDSSAAAAEPAEHVAAQHEEVINPAPRTRRHGGALPQ